MLRRPQYNLFLSKGRLVGTSYMIIIMYLNLPIIIVLLDNGNADPGNEIVVYEKGEKKSVFRNIWVRADEA